VREQRNLGPVFKYLKTAFRKRKCKPEEIASRKRSKIKAQKVEMKGEEWPLLFCNAWERPLRSTNS